MASDEQKRHRKWVVIESDPNEENDEVDGGAPKVVLRAKAAGGNVAGVVRRTILKIQNRDDDGGTNNSFLFSYLTVKVLLWDIGIALGDTITDFCQGVALLFTPGKEIYGAITLAINWVPGIPAAVHLLSMYRRRLPWKKTVLYALLLLLLYPILPILAYLNLLWCKPKDPHAVSQEFREAEFLATIANAISGGIESPVQLMFQSWLIFNGIVTIDFGQIFSLSISDWLGNTIYLPVTASATLIFSVISILKASVELNIVRVHVQDISSWKQGRKFGESLFDHLPFIAAETFFRIVSMLFCLTYLNSFGLLPIAVFWISTIIIGQRVYMSAMEYVPVWLISFISLFMPVCFTTEPVSSQARRNEIIRLQYRTFNYFSLSAFLLYGISLTAIGVIVNLPIEVTNFHYSSGVIFNHVEFNVLLGSLGVMGCLATAMSFRPTVSSFCKGKQQQTQSVTEEEDARQPCLPDVINFVDLSQIEQREKRKLLVSQKKQSDSKRSRCGSVFFILLRMIVTILVFLPVVLPLVYLTTANYSTPICFISYNPASNSSLTVRATQLTRVANDIRGISKLFSITEQQQQNDAVMTLQYIDAGTVAIVSRSGWDEKRKLLLETYPSAIVILDNSTYRPSSPVPKLWAGQDDSLVPVVLVRHEDADHLKMADGTIIRISVFADTAVVKPAWKCSTPGCLPPLFVDGHISGVQYRTTCCFWGGAPCSSSAEQNNTQESENFCSAPDTHLCPLNGQEFGVFQTYDFSGVKRTLRSSPAACVAYSNFMESIMECDKGMAAADWWSRWLGWQELRRDGEWVYRARRRYCYQKLAACLFEEQQAEKCCVAACADRTLPICSSG